MWSQRGCTQSCVPGVCGMFMHPHFKTLQADRYLERLVHMQIICGWIASTAVWLHTFETGQHVQAQAQIIVHDADVHGWRRSLIRILTKRWSEVLVTIWFENTKRKTFKLFTFHMWCPLQPKKGLIQSLQPSKYPAETLTWSQLENWLHDVVVSYRYIVFM